MEKSLFGPRSGENAWIWFIKAVTGLLLVVILVIHFVVNHLVAPNGLLSYTEVLRYYQNPIIPIMESFFVLFAVSHALIGLRGVILDLKPSNAALSAVNWLFTIVGSAAVIYGIWLIFTIVAKGASI